MQKITTFLEKKNHTNIPSINEDVKIMYELMKSKMHYFQWRKANAQETMAYLSNFIYTFGNLFKLICMYKECISQGEMAATVKQGIISLTPNIR